MPGWRSRYCGMALYLSNSTCHALASSGGTTPVTGFHSTIERPDSVSRVAPPTVSVTNIKAAIANSQSLMARRRVSERGASRVMRSLGCRRRCGPYSRAGTAAIERGHSHPSTQVRRCDHADRARGRRALMPMAFAQSPQVKANGTIEVIYYVVPGLGWVLPTTPQHRRDQQS